MFEFQKYDVFHNDMYKVLKGSDMVFSVNQLLFC